MMNSKNEYKKGIAAILSCMVLWGVLPIYWQALIPISSWVIILYRILTVCLYSVIAARFKYSFKEIFAPLKDKKTLITYIASGTIITLNWSIYIYAVNANQVVQSSLGYYIEPLAICLIGYLLFHEKLNKYNITAILFATVAIVVLLVHFGELPKISLLLALTFAVYTAIKKNANQPALLTMVYETFFLAPFALIAIIYLETHGMGALVVGDPLKYGLMLLCGLFTLIPLAAFAFAAKRLPMFQLGMFEYVSPTISLIIGITLLGESVDLVQIACFGLIWIGLVFFSYGEFKTYKTSYDAPEATSENVE